ncbi:MAG: DUF6485 family protein [Candidatus Nanoarchaeia archaeon]|nr:DUF6485 family protein [Candidatus Nanoarchaeia archaeon]
MECKQKNNLKYCNCTYDCNKKGICCECIRYHREKKQLPACYFDNKTEKSYDRSFEKFLEARK